ncbi:MAG: DUF370 domain-containing protein [Ruminococcaceae bacterium]|jgi:hypothetical protein|nr:DUF370 domain-containing protein [Oscillospiraceae bacterium]
MFIHIGQDTVVIDKEIIGIFDMDNTTVMKKTIDYLNNAEKEKSVINVAPFELPKSFIVCQTPKGKRIYISPVSVGTILRRIESGNPH